MRSCSTPGVKRNNCCCLILNFLLFGTLVRAILTSLSKDTTLGAGPLLSLPWICVLKLSSKWQNCKLASILVTVPHMGLECPSRGRGPPCTHSFCLDTKVFCAQCAPGPIMSPVIRALFLSVPTWTWQMPHCCFFWTSPSGFDWVYFLDLFGRCLWSGAVILSSSFSSTILSPLPKLFYFKGWIPKYSFFNSFQKSHFWAITT